MAAADALTELEPLGAHHRAGHLSVVWRPGWFLNAATTCELITPVPLPRKPSKDLLRRPRQVRSARLRETWAVFDDVHVDVAIGLGGYVAVPAYPAACAGRATCRSVPVVIHEANASA